MGFTFSLFDVCTYFVAMFGAGHAAMHAGIVLYDYSIKGKTVIFGDNNEFVKQHVKSLNIML